MSQPNIQQMYTCKKRVAPEQAPHQHKKQCLKTTPHKVEQSDDLTCQENTDFIKCVDEREPISTPNSTVEYPRFSSWGTANSVFLGANNGSSDLFS
jgi:hypothetical protein